MGIVNFVKKNSGNKNPIKTGAADTAPHWDFLTNHAHVLLCVSQDSGIRVRDIADAIGITERSAQNALSDLVGDGYVLRDRQGRRNRYTVKAKLPLPHPLEREHEVGELLTALGGKA